jgi:hypothetical protein
MLHTHSLLACQKPTRIRQEINGIRCSDALRRIRRLLFLLVGQFAALCSYAADCGKPSTNPRLFGSDIAEPHLVSSTDSTNHSPSFGRISRGGVEYISSHLPVIDLVTDGCTYIKRVQIGPLAPDGRPAQASTGYSYSHIAQVVPNPSDPNRLRHRVMIRLGNLLETRSPSTEQVSITVGRSGGQGTTTFSFPMVRVDRVEMINIRAPIGFSQAEFYNMFSKAIYTKFNGAQNSTVVATSHGDRRIYGFDPESLKVDIVRGDIRGPHSGVRFSFNFKVEIKELPESCYPTAKVNGWFHIDATSSGLALRWVSPVRTRLEFGGACETVRLVPLVGAIQEALFRMLESEASSSVRASLVSSLESTLPDPGSGTLFLDGSDTQKSLGISELELVIFVKIPVTSVLIKVPYGPLSGRGVAFEIGENVGLIASGLAGTRVDQVDSTAILNVGPNGLPRSGTTVSPNEKALKRTQPLPWDQAPIGRLLAKQISLGPALDSRLYEYTPGCTFKVGGSQGHLQPRFGYVQFGANETPGGARTHHYRLRLLFMNDLSVEGERCRSASLSPETLGR